jgi:GMP reductase
VPASLSNITSRNECRTTHPNGQLPFFVAPMDTVVNLKNLEQFTSLGLNVCLPRNERFSSEQLTQEEIQVFESYSLDEFIEKFCKEPKEGDEPIYCFDIHIDIANGHMFKLYEACKQAKIIWGDTLNLMIGNIANPKTYHEFAAIGVYGVKLGIGGGQACTTTTYTGVHFPMASLIMECRAIKDKYNFQTKIIADGGISSTSDVNKALACGADFVMMGNLFNRTYEACGQAYLWDFIPVPNSMIGFLKNRGFKIKRTYRGMSTTEVQKAWKKKVLRPSEGLYKYNEVLFPLKKLVSDLNHRLATAMSYTSDFELETFISGEIEIVEITADTNNRVNK